MLTDSQDKLEDNSFVMVGKMAMSPLYQRNFLTLADHKAYLTFGRKAIRLGDEDVTHMPCGCTSCLGLRKKCIGELERGDSSKKKKPQKLNRDMHLLCPPRVFGFALRQKVLVQMLVDNVKEMDQKDKETAYKKLELDSKSKNILKTLVLQHSNETNKIDDLIPGKGNGLIVLLHGPPGVGKTLTAESLALLSGKPLYSVSMSDVGTSPTVVEKNLIRVFELATHWKALLLFDEADVFLGTRTLDNLRRNSLVSVLIRILEYFEGILLTSNRVKTFDEAFQSRIHVAVRYKELTESSRVKIWRIWINKAGDNIDDLVEIEEQLESGGELAGAELNGRQIRNVFRSALALATARGVGSKLTYKDIRAVLSSTVEFQNYMVQNKELAEKAGIR
jgi:SpoVK/Ycf46/Vps4 family AAA+-type ATPase